MRILHILIDTIADALRLSLAAIKPGRAPEPVKERLQDYGDQPRLAAGFVGEHSTSNMTGAE